jgi:hypothetical protein
MILETILIFGIIFGILIFFYKQAIMEFRLAQTESFDKVPPLLQEKIPIVVQPFPIPQQLWTHADIQQRQSLSQIPIQEYGITIGQASQKSNMLIPWNPTFGTSIALATGLNVWAEQTLKPIFQKATPLASIYSYRTEVYLGPQGLQKTYGLTTILAVTDGIGTLTLLNEQSDPYLPPTWKGKLMSRLTRDEAPLIGQIQCIDVILRPGSCIVIPPHWKYCLEEKEGVSPICSVKITVHHPISRFMEHVSTIDRTKARV